MLRAIDFGKSVAEHDANLNEYFVDILTYNEVESDKIDIVRGQKGSGKSAILKRLMTKGVPGVRLKAAVNLQGEHDFRHIFELAYRDPDKVKTEQMLADAWKLYFLSVVVDEIGDAVRSLSNPVKRWWITWRHLRRLRQQLHLHKLLPNARSLEGKFRYAVSRVGMVITDPAGNSYDPYVELQIKGSDPMPIPFNDMYDSVEQLLNELNISIWVCLDRLDEVFQNVEKAVEHMALRSLLSAYKDLMHYSRVRVKIFIREDIFNRVTHTGFTALTHIRPRTSVPITWDRERLLHLVVERLQYPQKVKDLLAERNISLATNTEEREKLLKILFPPQIDQGKESDTFTWIVNRVKDGTEVSTPRDVIDLLTYAKSKQLSQWEMNPPAGDDSTVIIEPKAFNAALEVLSSDKLETHLFAEYPHLRRVVEKFRGKKSEYDERSLREILGDDWNYVAELVEVGFFKPRHTQKHGLSWWIPFIYRDGLGVRQGRYVRDVQKDESESDVVS